MNRWPLHTIFAVILVTSVAANQRASGVSSQTTDIKPAIIRVAQSHGLTLVREPTATQLGRTLVFDAPACAGPILISVLFVTFEEEPLVRSVREPGDLVRFVYLDRSWSVLPDRLTVFFEWKKHKALELFGLTSYVPLPYMLRIACSPGCEIVDAIDWQAVWRRDYLLSPGRG